MKKIFIITTLVLLYFATNLSAEDVPLSLQQRYVSQMQADVPTITSKQLLAYKEIVQVFLDKIALADSTYIEDKNSSFQAKVSAYTEYIDATNNILTEEQTMTREESIKTRQNNIKTTTK